MRPLILLGCLVAVSGESVSLTPFSPSAPAPLPLTPCHVDGLAEELRCGIHEVFEDRENSRGRRLPIHVAVMPALRRRVHRDALFLMAGGPGQGARGLAPVAARYFREVRRHRDIVLVDLRGTGESAPLRCVSAIDELAMLADADFAAAARRCAGNLEGDPRHYTHHDSLADLNEVRARLGYERVNLWGGSWGTRAALLFALRYPGVTRTVILDGAVPLTMEFPRTASADAQSAFNRLIDLCRGDSQCHAAFEDPRADLDRFQRRFTNGKATVTIPHPRTHAPVTLTLPEGIAADIIRGALYVPRDAAAVLHLIRQAAGGDFAPLLAQYLRTSSVTTEDMTLGATFAVLCSEDLPRVLKADFARDAAGSMFGTTYADIWQARCGAWPAGPGLVEQDDATSHVPALILSGGHDPVTPPRTGELMARHFPRHRHVVVPRAAHNASFSGCVPSVIAAFIEHGHGDTLDTACAGAVAWPPFVTGAAGTRP